MNVHYFDVKAVLEARRQSRCQNTWGNYLRSHDWTHYITLTFDRNTSAPRAWELFREWLASVQGLATLPFSWFAVLEVGRYGRTHFHVLLRATARTLVSKLERKWPYGRRSIRLYDPARGGSHYVSKLLHDPECEFDLCIVPKEAA